jgi:hypothetical protein
VLVAECGDGTLVRTLLDAGLDAYGCDHRLALSEAAALAGLDVRPDDVVDHLRSVDHEALGGLVLAGAVDRLPIGTQLSLADLAPGKPLHAETWAHLLQERGFRVDEPRRGSPQYLVTAARER